MKKLLFSLLFICTIQPSIGQNVFIADNNFNAPTGANIFPTIQQAVDAASAGDFIYIQPSPTTYGSVIIEKELHLVGIGFNLDKDLPHESTMTDITLRNNVDNLINPSNSTITGLDIRDIYPNKRSGLDYTLSGVKIYNCEINRLYWSSAATYPVLDALEIYDNYITGGITFANAVLNGLVRNNLITGSFDLRSTSPNSIIITNNIIYGSIDKSSFGDNLIIQNNYFIGSKGNTVSFSVMLDAIIANNIFYGRTPSNATGGNSTSTNFQRNIFTNNLSYETGNDELPPSGGGVDNSGDGNIEGSSPLFTNVLILNSWSSAYNFTLQAGSPALNAGSDGSDIGITGGPYPFTGTNFILDTTPLPTIQILNTSSVINPGDDLDVRIKAKSN